MDNKFDKIDFEFQTTIWISSFITQIMSSRDFTKSQMRAFDNAICRWSVGLNLLILLINVAFTLLVPMFSRNFNQSVSAAVMPEMSIKPSVSMMQAEAAGVGANFDPALNVTEFFRWTEDKLSSLDTSVTETNKYVKDNVGQLLVDLSQLSKNISSVESKATEGVMTVIHQNKVYLACIFTVLSCLLMSNHIMKHLNHFDKAIIRRRVTAVLMLVPVYSLSAFSELSTGSAIIPNFLVDFYESYALFMFLLLLIALITDGGDLKKLINIVSNRVAQQQQVLRVQDIRNIDCFLNIFWVTTIEPCFRPGASGIEVGSNMWYYQFAKTWIIERLIMVLQFVFVRPILSLFLFLLTLYVNDSKARFVINIAFECLQGFSMCIAVLGLMSFCHGIEEDLKQKFMLWWKFWCVKGTMIFIVCQYWFLVLVPFRPMSDLNGSQSFLLCLEMFWVTLAFIISFPVGEWSDKFNAAANDPFGLTDFYHIFRYLWRSFTESLVSSSPNESMPDDNSTSPSYQGVSIQQLPEQSEGSTNSNAFSVDEKRVLRQLSDLSERLTAVESMFGTVVDNGASDRQYFEEMYDLVFHTMFSLPDNRRREGYGPVDRSEV